MRLPDSMREAGDRVRLRRRPSALRRRRWSELRERQRQTVFLLPGLLTTGNLLAGFYSIVLSLDGRYQWAALALFVGMVMDMLDGKVARLTRTTTQFGIEFDSLADVVSFGVAPALLLYAWALQPLGRVGAGAAFLYVICGALRLARFNVLTGITDRRYFIGLPIPGAAGVVASTVLFFETGDFDRGALFALALATYLLAFLMISNIRYYSFKDLNFAKRHPFPVLLVAALGIVIVFAYPQKAAFLILCTYALSGPARWVVLRKPEPVPPAVLRESARTPGHPGE
jgi:CDP-diacylglycerol---serine O-phosphatidyltransferase